ncbi:conserved protein of unknown function [Methylacidimicrobium sp. AP8]|uniref:hypothetical protein n=1 Tax=Methylacidimicrobium sp. AP8 TaxID=2730359 RepID=UPI0018C00852|nr:hypothetical protein [Methylacidimicrobium sp. AP8]CAB4242542.1 conserved protein of unknown function [Methylacidimicrobium sp. AP8]
MSAFGRKVGRGLLRVVDLLVFVFFCASMVLLIRNHLGRRAKIVVEGRKGPLWEIVSPAETPP